MRDDADVTIAQQREWFRAWACDRADTDDVDLLETHVSIVAFGPDRVWKLKKAVRFPFVDLSTASARAANAERELALNRRFAPDVYLDVVPLVHDGVVVDTVVEMRRMPADRRLASVVAGGDAGPCIDQIADTLARVHRNAATGGVIDDAGTAAWLGRQWRANLDELVPFTPTPIDSGIHAQIGRDVERFLAGRGPLFAARIAAGRIRDGHGDLLADDVFCLDDGPRLLDCLEFDDRLRYGDVLADVAFCAMDLERLGRADLADRLFDRYRAATGDDWPTSLQHFSVAFRALIRSKVACLRIRDGDAKAPQTAAQLLALAADHLADGRVRLVVISGPPATGKSTLARRLAGATGWPVFHSDEVRKELAGLAADTSARAGLDAGLYGAEWTARTYGELFDRARGALGRGESAIVDASFASESHRTAVERLAGQTASVLSRFVCEVPTEVAADRARQRARTGHDASDAVGDVVASLHARFAPWRDATVLDGREPPDQLARSVRELIERDELIPQL